MVLVRVRVYVFVSVSVCVRVCVRVSVFMYVCVCVRVSVRVYLLRLCLRVYLCTRVCTFVSEFHTLCGGGDATDEWTQIPESSKRWRRCKTFGALHVGKTQYYHRPRGRPLVDPSTPQAEGLSEDRGG